MALICDADYLIHSLRLNYLRHVEDPYGPRIITFDPRYQLNPHIVASGSADSDRWNELNMPQSPQISDDEGTSGARNGRRRHSGFPGATGLKYTQTIMGNRSGVAGMRVSGRRITPEKVIARRSISAASSTPRRSRADSEPIPAAASNTQNGLGPDDSPDTYDESMIHVSKRRSAGGSSLQEIASRAIEKAELENREESSSLNSVPMALQSMTDIAAVQARRQRRRAHFTSSGGNAARPIIIEETKLNPDPESSSSEEEEGEAMSGSLLDDDEYIAEVEGSLEVENDGFDPDFAPPRIGFNSDSSDLLNSMSGSALSASISSPYNSSIHMPGSARAGGKLSPVDEAHPSEDHSSGQTNVPNMNVEGHVSDATTQQDVNTQVEDYFEMISPPVRRGSLAGPLKDANEDLTSHELNSEKRSSQRPSDLDFTRRKVPPIRPATSALTAKLAASDTSTNPFTEQYALISGRAEIASMEVTVYFPHATKPANKPMKLNVRKDATIEEVIGFSLWSYWEEGWLPRLDEGVSEEKKKERLSAVGWVLRIAEEDGEVDEDFPAPDRMGKMSKFNFEAYAILEATPAQVSQNAQLEAKIIRRPSRIIVSKNKPEASAGLAPPAPSLGPSVSTMSSAFGTSVGTLPSSLNISSSHGSQVLLRIRMANVDDKAMHYSTTISVYSTMYMQEVLEQICKKRKIDNPKDWALLSDDFKVLVPLDRTVASLEGNLRLVLIQREMLPLHGFAIDGDKRTARSIDPNASIFKRISEVQPKNKVTDSNFDVYKRYTVWRKVPMLVARLERTLAIDGDYIHIMPSANKARVMFDSGKTVSYHIKSVVNCSQSAKASATFKIIFRREGGDKRYDFEAESAKQATEIVSTIRGMRLKGGLERSGTAHKIRRRSKHVI